MNSIRQLSVTDLKKAITIKERIEKLEEQLMSLVGDANSIPAKRGRKPSATPRATKKRNISPEGRAAISAAAKARWAREKDAKAEKGAAKNGKVKASKAQPVAPAE